MHKKILFVLLGMLLIGNCFIGISRAEESVKELTDKGVEYANANKFEDALIEFNKVIKIDSNYADGYYNRANVLVSKGEMDQALTDYDMAIEINPKDADFYGARGIAHNYKGNAYLSKGNYGKVILDCNKAIKLNPKYADAYVNRGAAYNAKRKHDQAIADFNKAISLNPNIPTAYYNRAAAYFYKRQYQQSWDDV